MFVLGVLGGFAVWRAGAMDTPLLIGGGLVLVVFGRALSFKLTGADYPLATAGHAPEPCPTPQ
ncbi:hypothetical protein ACFXGT_39785 [Streptomyces sp. NPDC059352]|uniref:hypothetical protein n=1 Tax=Streptomyces sp. NPDC059352 TaxID=3346810 RepID=UPI0036A99C17